MPRHTGAVSGPVQSTAAKTSASRSAAAPGLSQLPSAEPVQHLSTSRQLGSASPVANSPIRPPAAQGARSGSPLSRAAQQLRRVQSKSPSFGASSQAGHLTGSNSPPSACQPALSKSFSHGSNSSGVGSFNANRSITSQPHAAAADADAAAVDPELASPDHKSLQSPRGQGMSWHKSSSFSPRQYNARNSPRVSLETLQYSPAHTPKPVMSPRPSMSPGQRLLFTDDVELTPPPLLLAGSPGAQVLSPRALTRMLRRKTSAASGAITTFALAADNTSSPPKRRSTSSGVLYFQHAGSNPSTGTNAVAALLGSPGPGGAHPVLNSSPGTLSSSSLHSTGSAGKRRSLTDCNNAACDNPPQQEAGDGNSRRSSANSSRRTSLSYNQPQHQQQQRQGSGNSILDAMSGMPKAVGASSAGQQQASSLHGSPNSDVEVRQQRRSGSVGVQSVEEAELADKQHNTLRHVTPYLGTEVSEHPGDGAEPGLSLPHQQHHHQPTVMPGHHEQHAHHESWPGMPYAGRELSFAGAGSHHATEQQQPLPGSPRSPRSPKAVSFEVPTDEAEQEHATLRDSTPYPGRGSGGTGQYHGPGRMYESPSITDLVGCGQRPEGQQQNTSSSRRVSSLGQSSRKCASPPAPELPPPASAVVRFDVLTDTGAGEVVGEDCSYIRKGTPFPGREDRGLGDEQLPAGVRFLNADPLPAAAAAVPVPQQLDNSAAADKQYTRKAPPHPGKLDELTGRLNQSQLAGEHFTAPARRSTGEGKGIWHPTTGEQQQERNAAVSVNFLVAKGQGAGEVVTDDAFVRKSTPYPGRLDSFTEDQQAATAAGAAVSFVVAEGQGAGEVASDHTYPRKGTPHPGRLDSLTNSPPTAARIKFLSKPRPNTGEVIDDHSYARKGTPYPSRPDDNAEHQAAAARGSAGVRFTIAQGTGAGEVDTGDHASPVCRGTPHPDKFCSKTDDQSEDLENMLTFRQDADELQHSVGCEDLIAYPRSLGEGRGLIRVRFSVSDGGGAGEVDSGHHFTRQPTPFVREAGIEALEQQQQRQLVHVNFSLREGLGPGESDGHQHRPVRNPTPYVHRRSESWELEQPGAVRFEIPDSQGEHHHEQHHQRKPNSIVPRVERYSAGGARCAGQTDAEGPIYSLQPPNSDSSHPQHSQQQHQRRSRSSGSSVHFAAEPGLQSPNSTQAAPRSSSSSPVMQQCTTHRVVAGSDAQQPYTCSSTGHSIGSSRAHSSRCSTSAGGSPDGFGNPTYSRGSTTASNYSESPPHATHSTVSSTNSSIHGGRQYKPIVQHQEQQQDEQHYTRKDTPYPVGQGDDDSHDLILDLLQQELAAMAAGTHQKPTGASPRSTSSSAGPSSMRVSRSSTGGVAHTALGTQPLRSSMKQSSSNPSRCSSFTSARHDGTVKLSVTPYIAVVHIPATGGIWDSVNSGRASPAVQLSSAASVATSSSSPRASGALGSPTILLSPTTVIASSAAASLKQSHHYVSAPCSLDRPGASLPCSNSFKAGTHIAPVSEPVLGGSADHAKQQSLGSAGLHSVPETDYSAGHRPSRSEGSWTLSPRCPSDTAPSVAAEAREAPKLRTTQSLGAAVGSTSVLPPPIKGEHRHSGILAKAAHAANRLLHKSSSGHHKASGSSPSSPKGSTHISRSPGKQLLHAIGWTSHKGSLPASESETHHQHPAAGGVGSSSPASPHGKNPAAPGSFGSGSNSYEGRVLGHSSATPDYAHDSNNSKRICSSCGTIRNDGAATEGKADHVGGNFVSDGDSAVDPAVVALADLFRGSG